ncbi:MAG TPA: hypothetical protein VMU12_02105 [Candidatus Paceibacterota bacterium]|nr:hypothetical protein [Candidatus Paceibacterota bacterium]
MKFRLFVAFLAVVLFAGLVNAAPLPSSARRVESAIIEMTKGGEPVITYLTKDVGSQCFLNPDWAVTVILRSDIDGVYINDGCTHEGPIPCFCDIYVRTADTKWAWEKALEPYRQEHKQQLQVDPSPNARIESSGISYSIGMLGNNVAVAGMAVDVKRGDLLTVAVDASVPMDAESPCSDPLNRPCQLSTEVWQVFPDGARQLLLWPFESADQSVKVWLEPGHSTHVSLHGYFPGSVRDALPHGKAVLVGKWFLWKYAWSLADYQVPVGTFEIPLYIK